MSSFERMSKAAPSGGYICTLSEEDLASQRGVIWDLVKSFGKNLVAAKELTSISMPVRLFEPRSYLERLTDGCALYKGGLVPLVQAGVVGSLLGDLLLLPGLSMIAGGLKYHEQRFSSRAAGVSSVLLIVSIIGVFGPTMYWQVNGDTTFSCDVCVPKDNSTIPLACTQCHTSPVDFYKDPLFQNTAQPLIYAVAAILPVSYLVGLLFTLKTHAHIFSNAAAGEGEGGDDGHDAPRWSKLKAVIILAVSIVLFSLVAEELVKAIEPTLEALNIGQTFAGVTVLALVPSSAELTGDTGTNERAKNERKDLQWGAEIVEAVNDAITDKKIIVTMDPVHVDARYSVKVGKSIEVLIQQEKICYEYAASDPNSVTATVEKSL
ncbi:uncharacterized protein ACA1_244530 [Acanthamoeba castellanii str. Neff]|uniref:Sodium/calcium exchanger membrane region domain-containing protein n=2 Tax=Acanthamoeba castellanii (strain ATCC 30010 / Neff) TaxID=1257118 RepID=L8GL22_ACACF|nr:uncharacterized protein ACA1_244530 [Acanthamoeba castellanii str. Neff]ELR13423.1 hypothetical protein ACA1_244530 [Acanthamoeba castellanii str. Neff]